MIALAPILLMGPTASGKSALALAMAERLDAEIVSVDSAQVYRGMDIGTAKPSPTEQARVAHHLIDIADPGEAYSAARFAEDARVAIEAIRARGRRPLLVGGTMLYFHALTRGLSALPAADPALRAELGAAWEQRGPEAMHARLALVDPASAARLHVNDRQRVLRALEVHALCGEPLSGLQRRGRHTQPWPGLALAPGQRAELHQRIGKRFEGMMDNGFLAEVVRLRERGGLSEELPSMRAVGYRQLWGHLEGLYGLDEAVQRGIAATRQLAKRQLTWLRSEAGLIWLDPGDQQLEERALGHIQAWDREPG